jgi:hypothetical protein
VAPLFLGKMRLCGLLFLGKMRLWGVPFFLGKSASVSRFVDRASAPVVSGPSLPRALHAPSITMREDFDAAGNT